MIHDPVASSELPDELELAHQQALKYGRDLARIYIAEKAKREKLEVAYQALSAAFASNPDGLVVLDDDLKIQQANTAFANLVESSVPALFGMPIDEALPSEELRVGLLRFGVGDRPSTQIDFNVSKPVRRSLFANIARLQSGRLRGWVIAIHDQSERKRLENQKADFINIAAHELRTPMGAILGYSEMLREVLGPNASEEQRLYLESILKGGYRLNGIVTEILQFAELNQGNLQAPGITTFVVIDLLEDILADLKQRASECDIALELIASDPEIQMTADAAILRPALYQLILNGINFNKAGGYVRIRMSQIDEEIFIDISDSGIGIPQDQLEAVLQPFFQLEEHITRHTGGLGLGLSLARRAVAQLGGNLAIDSVLNEGTTVHLQCPVRQPIISVNSAELQAQLETAQRQSVAYARDLQQLYSQLQQANRELIQTNKELEEANRLKSGFLDAISHELRSPFVPIDFALQAFSRYGAETFSPEQLDLLDQLRHGTKDARQLIENLIAYAALIKEQGKLNLETLDMVALINEQVDVTRMKSRRKNIAIYTELPDRLSLPAGDHKRIGDAIWHLLDNAVKFTEPGGEVVARAHMENEIVMVEIRDTGVGIAPDKQAEIWNKFAHYEPSLRRGLEGLGLGLSLVSYVVSAHGGEVILHSEPGKGSVFGFWLPLHPPAEA
ncbi:MAG: PAS domain-containing protein [Anaerolineae bacterium]|nr:PAS domain-containing protein [Anaerolineae bacterium]